MLLPFESTGLVELSAELDAWKDRLDHKGPLPRAWEGRLRRDLEAEAVAASTMMEGVPVTLDEVRRLLAGETPTSVTDESRDLVLGYKEAMEFVLRRAEDPSFRWNTELVIGLHDRVLGGRFSLGAGRFRGGQRWVANSRTGQVMFLPPPAEEVSALVDEACARMDEMENHPAVKAAWIHVAMAAIHPFGDGNGRTARVLSSLAMYRGGFHRREFTSLEEWWGRHLDDYYRAFECLGSEFDRSVDVTPFIETHVRAQLSQVRALDMRERAERRVWTILEDLAEEIGLPRRVANGLWDAFFGREVTAGYYRSLSDVSPQTATNDLTAASASGLLRAVGAKRGRKYLPGGRLYAEIGRILEVPITEPGETLRAAVLSELSRRTAVDAERIPLSSPSEN